MKLVTVEGLNLRVRKMMAWEAPQKAYGIYWDHTRTIAIDASLTPAEQAPILIHEIIHAIWSARKMGKRATEESVCTHLGVALAEILRDNPDLLGALDGALNHGVPIVGSRLN